MLSANFVNIVEPVYNTVFDGIYKDHPAEWSKVFKTMQGMKRRRHEEDVLYGFGAAIETGEGSNINYDEGGESYLATYTYKKYGLAFKISEELAEDGEHISVGTKYSRHLAISMNHTKELVHANILNRSETAGYEGGDGDTLLSTSHPLPGGGTYSNRLTTAANLSETSLEQLLIDISNAVNDRGLPVQLTGEYLVVPPALAFTAERLLKSQGRVGTADNDLNAIKSMGLVSKGWCKITRLTSSTRWFVTTDAPEGLKHLPRGGVKRGMEGDFETGNMRYKATERYAAGWTDARGIYGSAGV